MAYDRYDPRDQRPRWFDDRNENRDARHTRGRDDWAGRDERGFFDRAGDEIASWFGDEEAERRRREDQMREEREARFRGSGGYSRDRGWGDPTRVLNRGGFSDSDYNPTYRRENLGSSQRNTGRDYRGDYLRSPTPWSLDEYRNTSRAGTADWSDRSRHEDPNYQTWRQRQMDELDRDYDDFRRENQSRFENDFGSWRERRVQKRGMLGKVREHMEVVGSDDVHVGTIDRVAGDRIILTRSDPESGGVHHSLSCSDIDRVEGERVILDCSADQAKQRWRDESRDRALFEREDQGDMGPRALGRSFEGTYR